MSFLNLCHIKKKLQINSFHYDYIRYYIYGLIISLITTGVLTNIYPAHNILGISVTISSILYLIMAMGLRYIDAHTYYLIQFCLGITMGGAYSAISRVWTYWVPLNTQSIRHVPIILFEMINNDGYLDEIIAALYRTYSSYTITLSFGVIGLAWYVLWLYVINGNQFWRLNRDIILFGGSNNSRYPLQKPEVSLTRSIVSDIQWKSLFTSTPVLVIFLLTEMLDQLNIILLILIVILVELVPEIIVSISTTDIRKFWNWLYFGSMIIYYNLETMETTLGNTLTTNRIYQYILQEIEYLYYFGFYINYLDIAPKYAGLISSLLYLVKYTSNILYDEAIRNIFDPKINNDPEIRFLKAAISILMGTLYFNFGSAEIQPWAVDKPVEENQQNLVENEDLPSV